MKVSIPRSPKITGPCGIATLLHYIGRPQLLERLLDVHRTEQYDLRIHPDYDCFQDLYVKRRGNNVKVNVTFVPCISNMRLSWMYHRSVSSARMEDWHSMVCATSFHPRLPAHHTALVCGFLRVPLI